MMEIERKDSPIEDDAIGRTIADIQNTGNHDEITVFR